MSKQKMRINVPDHEGQLSLLFSKGGTRTGAGRKGIGVTKKVSITLKAETWAEIEKHCSSGDISKSELLRNIIESYWLEIDKRKE